MLSRLYKKGLSKLYFLQCIHVFMDPPLAIQSCYCLACFHFGGGGDGGGGGIEGKHWQPEKASSKHDF